MADIDQIAESVHEEFSDQLDITQDDVKERLETLTDEYKVPADEARRSLRSSYLDETGMERSELRDDSEKRSIDSIEAPEEWVEITAKVVRLWDAEADAVDQVGLLGDETGTIKFTKWAKSDLQTLEEGEVYDLGNLVTDEYEGRFSVKLNSSTTIEESDTELEVSDVGGGGSEETTVTEIDEPENWVSLRAKVTDLWEPRNDSIAQVGLTGDETGTIKFTKWAKSDLQELEEGVVYQFDNIVTDEYEGRFSVKLNRTTDIEELDEDLEVGDNSVSVEGALVDIQSGSGLIKRCPDDDCTRVLQNGRCSEHGDVEGEFDLRIKAALDDGESVHEAIFNEEATEELTDITLDEAKEMAMDALDTAVVADDIRDMILGQYYRVAGPELGRYVLANEFEQLSGAADAEETLIRARSM